MDKPDVLEKYQQFVNDFNSGMNRTTLCAKYRLANDRYDAFLEFLVRRGFVLLPPGPLTEEAKGTKCPKCGYERTEADALVDAAQCPKCHIIYAKWSPIKEQPSTVSAANIFRPLDFDKLVYSREPALFLLHQVISVAYWLSLLVVTKGSFLFLLPFIFLGYLFAQSALLSHLKGNGIKLSESQFPELYNRHISCCRKLGLPDYPDAYVINGSGFLNAFASRFLGRNFVVLYSNVIHGLADQPEAINFYIGHELGHIKQNHLLWGPFLWPASILPLVGAAYSRAREYTCDQFGRACCDNAESAMKGLIALSAGENLWSNVDVPAYLKQLEQTSGFWMSLHELVSDYPWLVKRAARIGNPSVTPPARNTLAWFFALFMPRIGVGGSLSGMLVTVAIIGILAAIAIPQFQQYRLKAQNAQGLSQMQGRNPSSMQPPPEMDGTSPSRMQPPPAMQGTYPSKMQTPPPYNP